MANNPSKFVQMPLTLEQIVFGLKQLPKEDIERLDLMLDDEFREMVIKRNKTAWQEYKSGETLSLDEIKRELDV